MDKKGNPRFGEVHSRRTEERNVVPLKDWKKVFDQKIKEWENQMIANAKEVIKDQVTKVYSESKNYLETVVLENEDPKENVQHKIETQLIFEEDPKNKFELNAKVVTPSRIEAEIILAQDHGTAMGMDKGILDYFGVSEKKMNTKDNKPTNFSKWYFSPNNAHFKIIGKITSFFKSKIIRK